MKKQNLTHSITLSAILILGLSATVSLAGAAEPTSSSGDSVVSFDTGRVGGSDIAVDMPVEFKPNDNRPHLLDEQRAERAAMLQAMQAKQLECLQRRIARAAGSGQTTINWSIDSLPPACQRFTAAVN